MNASRSIVVWEWEAQTHVWVPHSPKLCQHIENAYRRCMGTGSVDLGGQNEIAFTGFQLDFVRMKQVNANTSRLYLSFTAFQIIYHNGYKLCKKCTFEFPFS